MAKDIVMVHGANEGGWCFDKFKGAFEGLGFTCHTPDLIFHGSDATDAKTRLVGIGMADYLAQLQTLLKTFATPPVLLGHSMGGILVQQLAAEGLAKALILIAPAPRSGILPATGSEKRLDQNMMSLGAFWRTVINSGFRSRQNSFAELRAGSRSAYSVRQIRTRVRIGVLSDVLLDVRPDQRDRGRYQGGSLSRALPRRHFGSSTATATCSCSSPAPRI